MARASTPTSPPPKGSPRAVRVPFGGYRCAKEFRLLALFHRSGAATQHVRKQCYIRPAATRPLGNASILRQPLRLHGNCFTDLATFWPLLRILTARIALPAQLRQ